MFKRTGKGGSDFARSASIGLAVIVLAALAFTTILRPSAQKNTDNSAIVVVHAAGKVSTAETMHNNRADEAIAPVLSQVDESVDSYRTNYTNEESTEIDKIDQTVRQEPRDDAWASSAEKSITDSMSRIPTVHAADTSVVCGSKSCFFSVRVPSAASDFDKQVAIEAVEQSSIPDGVNGSLFTSRMFSEKQVDGSFIIRTLIIRS